MSRLRISPRAGSDLIEIWSYIAEGSEAKADAFIDKLYEMRFSLECLRENFWTAEAGTCQRRRVAAISLLTRYYERA
jgi:hypothetical protein